MSPIKTGVMLKEIKQNYEEKWLPRPRASIPQTSAEIHWDNPFSVPWHLPRRIKSKSQKTAKQSKTQPSKLENFYGHLHIPKPPPCAPNYQQIGSKQSARDYNIKDQQWQIHLRCRQPPRAEGQLRREWVERYKTKHKKREAFKPCSSCSQIKTSRDPPPSSVIVSDFGKKHAPSTCSEEGKRKPSSTG